MQICCILKKGINGDAKLRENKNEGYASEYKVQTNKKRKTKNNMG